MTDEEADEIGDLERRLKLYQVIRQVLPLIRESLSQPPIFYRDPRRKVVNPVFSPTAEITLPGFQTVMERLICDLPKPEVLAKTTIKRLVNIEEVINDLTHRIQSALSMSFNDFVKNKSTDWQREKINIIVSFLALLELFKQGLITLNQAEHFSDIKIEIRSSDTPHYG